MNCHIIPMIYLKDWSTPETFTEKNRHLRKIYWYNRNELIPHLEYTEKIPCPNISSEDLYILESAEDKKVIENFLDVNFENKFEKHLKRVKKEALSENKKVYNLDFLLEFMVFQMYREPNAVLPAIEEAVNFINKAIPLLNNISSEWTKTCTHDKFLRLLLHYAKEKDTSAIQKSILNLKRHYEKIIVIGADSKANFITSDFPVFNIQNPNISGLYFPIAKNICLILRKNNFFNKADARVFSASKDMVFFINELIRQASSSIVLSERSDMKNILSTTPPLAEYKRLVESPLQ